MTPYSCFRSEMCTDEVNRHKSKIYTKQIGVSKTSCSFSITSPSCQYPNLNNYVNIPLFCTHQIMVTYSLILNEMFLRHGNVCSSVLRFHLKEQLYVRMFDLADM